ncbi:MAG: hypothetical protein XD78_2112 [Desulfotomaculum sp. 46_296]|nr:MAG: hypothetical protein XD78_2112 [Desulfotomaculum sp. 46_296]
MFYQMQNELQTLRDHVNSISQLASRLQQDEMANSAHLQQLQQKEINATQNLQHIAHLARDLDMGMTRISSMAQQSQTMGTYQYGTPGYTHAQTGWASAPAMGTQYGVSGGWGTTQGLGQPRTQFGYSQQPGFGMQQFSDPRSFISRQEYTPSRSGYTLQNRPENVGMGMTSSFSPSWGTSWSSPVWMHQDPYAINRAGYTTLNDPASFIHQTQYTPNRAGYTLLNAPENVGMGTMGASFQSSFASPALTSWSNPYLASQTAFTPNRANYTLLNTPENIGMSAVGSNISSFASPAMSSFSNPYLSSQSAYMPNRAGFMLQNAPESSIMSRSF